MCETGFLPPLCVDPCEAGKWGDNCTSSCYCYAGSPCDLVNGTCPDDLCDFGHQGETCSETCEDGFFGINCVSLCGRCEDDEICSPETGECNRCQVEFKIISRDTQ
mgnify:CR=1 FL=1